ncbi:MAG TPA: protein kinase [Thermoanaerobaculia bacterium]
MTIEAGTRLGPYRVDALIGQGGMGQVYRGVDTRLDRVVAIKVLPSHLSSHPQLRERFDREARAVSSLSDPHICTLFDVGRHDGIDYLVMEHLEGESLADRLSRGPLPLDQVIRYGTDIANALSTAHRHGVVHRDLKPGNVMLTKSGAKLLDFGLARTATATVSSPDAPTEHHDKPLTAEGTLLGTFQYMAPEQVEGREADARSDLFAFGAVLYEMVTGSRAFDGKSKASVIASILDREPPPVSSVHPATPPPLERLIRACLTKNPDDRLQSARDAALALQWIGSPDAAQKPRRRVVWPVVAALALAIAAALAAYSWQRGRAVPAAAMNLALLPPPGFTFINATISRQNVVAFVAGTGEERALFTRRLDEPSARQLAHTNSNAYPFWSPDGKWIAYFLHDKLMKVAAAGGAPEVICKSSYGLGGAWGDDGQIVFTPGFGHPLHVVSSAGGESRPLTRLDAKRNEGTHAWPVLLPDGRGILYLSVTLPTEMSRIFHIPAGGGTPKEVIAADALVGYSAPYLLFVRGRHIYAARFDLREARVDGEPHRLGEPVHFSPEASSAFASVTPDGTLLYIPPAPEKRRIVWYGRDGRSLGVVFEGNDLDDPRVSPDGKRLLVTKTMPETGHGGVYSVDLERGVETLLTPPPRFGWGAVWLRDGERFVFTSAKRSSYWDLFIQADDPQAQAVPLWEAASDDKEAFGLSPDGRHVLVREFTNGKSYDIWLVPVDGKGPRIPLLDSPATEYSADISPDGRWLVYATVIANSPDVYVRAVSGGRSHRVSAAGGWAPRWSRDGSEIFFLTGGDVLASARFSAAGGTPSVGSVAPLFRFDRKPDDEWDLSPDGTRFLVNEVADAATSVRPYAVVTGWKEALDQ